MTRSACLLILPVLAAFVNSGCHRAGPPTPIPFYATVHPTYGVTDLGILPGGKSVYVTGINNKGQIVGWVKLKDFNTHAFLWNGRMTDLGTSAIFPSCKAFAINDHAQIVGQDQIGTWNNFERHSFVWENGKKTMLPNVNISLGQTGEDMEATAINNQGQVVGDKGYLWQNGGTDKVGFFSVGINASGQVVGQDAAPYAPGTPGYQEDESPERTSTAWHPFLWESGSITDLGLISGAEYAQSSGINATGQATGCMTPFMSSSGFSDDYSFFWNGSQLVRIANLNGFTSSQAHGLNDHGQVVGKCVRRRGYAHAYCWQNGTVVDLNDFIPKKTGWVLEAAYKINDHGQIIGVGTHGAHHYRAFLLMPQK